MLSFKLELCAVFVFSACLNFTSSYPFGAPLEACESRVPSHGRARVGDLGYNLVTSNTWFYAGQTLTFHVDLGKNSGFRGIIMQVINSAEISSGNFKTPEKSSGFKTMDCFGKGDTLTHANTDLNTGTRFVWTAPSTCEATDYVLKATIVKSFRQIQTDMKVVLECSELSTVSTDVSTTTPSSVLFSKGNQSACMENTSSSISEEYHTGFENPQDLRNWQVRGWRRHSGRTQSPLTGPYSAAEGNYYVYFETSRPVSIGDQAVLETMFPAGIQGCFCLMMQINFYVDETGHILEVFVGTKLVYEISAKNTNWEKLEFQLFSIQPVQVRIVGTKGRSFRGDMAVDDVRIRPGLCSDDKD